MEQASGAALLASSRRSWQMNMRWLTAKKGVMTGRSVASSCMIRPNDLGMKKGVAEATPFDSLLMIA
jgi:hypothetical protein